jgi:putative DNA primase/helicase
LNDPTPPIEPSGSLVQRLKRNDAGDREERQALSVLGALVKGLPDTDDLLLTEESRRAFRVLRDRTPEIYLVYRAAIRQRAGRHIQDLLDAYIGPPSPGPRREIFLLSIPDLMMQPPQEWRVDKLFPKRGLGVIFGPPGSGKSFLAQTAVLHISRGIPLFGRETKPCRILYVCAEGRARDRVAAYLQANDLSAEQLDVKFVEQSLDLCGASSDLEQLEAHVAAFSPEMIVIDTLARVAMGGDENAAGDMGRLIGSFRRLEEACGGLVLVVHHTGKDIERGARGHSSLRAAVDVEIEVTRDDRELRTARVSKLRDAQDGAEFSFRLETVQLDEDRSSCVVVPVDDAPKRDSKERHLTANEKLCLEALNEQLEESGQQLPETSTIPAGRKGVEIDAWRGRFYGRIGESIKADSQRRTFSRAKEGLLAKRVIGCWERWVWKW